MNSSFSKQKETKKWLNLLLLSFLYATVITIILFGIIFLFEFNWQRALIKSMFFGSLMFFVFVGKELIEQRVTVDQLKVDSEGFFYKKNREEKYVAFADISDVRQKVERGKHGARWVEEYQIALFSGEQYDIALYTVQPMKKIGLIQQFYAINNVANQEIMAELKHIAETQGISGADKQAEGYKIIFDESRQEIVAKRKVLKRASIKFIHFNYAFNPDEARITFMGADDMPLFELNVKKKQIEQELINLYEIRAKSQITLEVSSFGIIPLADVITILR